MNAKAGIWGAVFALFVLLVIARTASQSPESVANIPHLGLIILAAVVTVIAGIGVAVCVWLDSSRRQLSRRPKRVPNRRRSSRRWWQC